MNWNIQTELPLWLIPIGIALVVLLAWLSYYTPKAKQLFPRWARIALISLRSIALLLIFLLFLGPRIISRISNSIKPLFILAVDNSSSMRHSDSITDGQLNLENDIRNVRAVLEENFDVQTYLFGEDLKKAESPDYSDKATDFNILFEELTSRHHSDPVNGLLLFSDGIYNQGANPTYADNIFPFKVHTVAYGDTSIVPDLLIKEVIANDLVYKNTRFPVQMLFESLNLIDIVPRVTVSSGNRVLLDTIAEFFPGENSGILRFNLNATETGIQNFRIRISGKDTETNLINNQYSLTVEAVEHKAKVLILYGAPHPDISAISSAIGEMEQFELESSDINTFNGRLKDYELVIFHLLPLPASQRSQSLMEEYVREKISALFIIGPQTDLNALNRLNIGLSFDDVSAINEDITGSVNSKFSLFTVEDLLSESIKEWPPLKGPFSPITVSSRSEVLIFQNIKSIQLDYPLICFTKSRAGKNGFIIGEGIWRWRLAEYLESSGSIQLNTVLKDIVQYLVIEENREQFKIDVPKTLSETEKLIVKAQVYNESYEAISGMIVDFKLIDSTGLISEYVMSSGFSGYGLELDPLKPGMYSYTSETIVGKERFKKQGQIHIQDVMLEEMFVTANFTILEQLANQKKGHFFTMDNYDEILTFAKDLEPGDESVRIESKWINLLQLKYLLFIIVFLLTLEWLLRRWFGTR